MNTEQKGTNRLLTIGEVAQTLRVSKGTVYKMVREGRVPAVQLGAPGASLRVPSKELRHFLFDVPDRAA